MDLSYYNIDRLMYLAVEEEDVMRSVVAAAVIVIKLSPLNNRLNGDRDRC